MRRLFLDPETYLAFPRGIADARQGSSRPDRGPSHPTVSPWQAAASVGARSRPGPGVGRIIEQVKFAYGPNVTSPWRTDRRSIGERCRATEPYRRAYPRTGRDSTRDRRRSLPPCRPSGFSLLRVNVSASARLRQHSISPDLLAVWSPDDQPRDRTDRTDRTHNHWKP